MLIIIINSNMQRFNLLIMCKGLIFKKKICKGLTEFKICKGLIFKKKNYARFSRG